MQELALIITAGMMLCGIIVPISTIAMLKVHNANKQGNIMIEYLTPALLFFVLAFAVETRMKLAKLCGRLDEAQRK